MTVTEIWLGIPCTQAAQSAMLDKGYQLQPHTHGAHRQRYVMAVRAGRSEVGIWRCLSAAVRVFGIEEERIIGETKDWRVYRARAAGIWAARQLGHSSPRVGKRFNRDHSTVLMAERRCEEMQAEDDCYYDDCQRVMSMVRTA
jgi:chromosomal replication initiation ATPase DnaA